MSAKAHLHDIAALYDALAIDHNVKGYIAAKTSARLEQLATLASEAECGPMLEQFVVSRCVRKGDSGAYELVEEEADTSEADALLARHMPTFRGQG